jgi:hypothetical protein
MPIQLNQRDVVPPAASAVCLGTTKIVGPPEKPVPVRWSTHTHPLLANVGRLEFSSDPPRDGGSQIVRYELLAEGSTTPISSRETSRNRAHRFFRAISGPYSAIFTSTVSTATFTCRAFSAFGVSPASDTFTLSAISVGTVLLNVASGFALTIDVEPRT